MGTPGTGKENSRGVRVLVLPSNARDSLDGQSDERGRGRRLQEQARAVPVVKVTEKSRYLRRAPSDEWQLTQDHRRRQDGG